MSAARARLKRSRPRGKLAPGKQARGLTVSQVAVTRDDPERRGVTGLTFYARPT